MQVWDARGVVHFDTAVGAMLGDPFQYARSANLDLLVRLIKGQETTELVRVKSNPIQFMKFCLPSSDRFERKHIS